MASMLHFIHCSCLQGNHDVVKSPDEYTVQVESARGMKEWQFDQIFMPDSTQEKVFEDTNVPHCTLPHLTPVTYTHMHVMLPLSRT